MNNRVVLESFADLKDHELTLWGVVESHQDMNANLVVRGQAIGYVHATRIQKRSPRIRIAIQLAREEEVIFGEGAMKKFETTVVEGVRKCLWGDGSWPKHTVELVYRVDLIEH